MSSVLSCSVRTCGLPLERADRVWRCQRGHSFDVSRSGYVNLLQPQDRRSAAAGDSRDAIEARARTFAAGAGRGILDRFVERAAAVSGQASTVVVDLGSGSGDALAALARARPIEGIGIDLSPAAADRAARSFPDLTWVVANADRRLPLLDQRVSLVLSLHGRRNPSECARVLAPGGHLLVAVPAADDLAELRDAVQGAAASRDRAEGVVDAHASGFALVERTVARETVHAGQRELRDLLRGTYRGLRLRDAARADALTDMDVTLASDFLLFERE